MTSARARTDIRLAGAGGQGVVLAGVILAEAAVLDGQSAVQSQAYGPQSRGGASRADVSIGTGIGFPVSDEFDILVALNRDALHRYAGCLRAGGLLIADEQRASTLGDGPWRALMLPVAEMAAQAGGQAAGARAAANVIALGALVGVTGIVRAEALETAARARLPAQAWLANRRALCAGLELGQASRGRCHGS